MGGFIKEIFQNLLSVPSSFHTEFRQTVRKRQHSFWVCHRGNKRRAELLPGMCLAFLLNNAHETILRFGINPLNLQQYCLGWVLFPFLSIETATLERLSRPCATPSRSNCLERLVACWKAVQKGQEPRRGPRQIARLPPDLPPSLPCRTVKFSFFS